MSSRGSPWVRLAAVLALLAPALVVFAPGLGYPFLQLDDVPYIVENPGLRDLSWRGIRFLFLEDRLDARYFPLSYLSLAVDHRLFGWEPFGFHLVNLLLHLANTLLVFGLVRRLTRDQLAAAVTAVLFSIHPLQVESVAWIISRKNVLFLLFFLLAAHAYLRFVEERGRRNGIAAAALAASALGYLLACLSKTAAITLPVLLLVFDLHRDGARADSALAFLRRHVPSKLVFVPPLLLVLLMSQSREHPLRTDYPFGPFEWAQIVGHNFFFYVAKTFLPSGLGVFYPLPAPGAVPGRFLLYGALAALLLFVLLWSAWRRRSALFLGLAWYFVTILPLAAAPAVFSDLPLLAADRYYYQSGIGLFLPVGVAVSALWRRRTALRPALLAAGGALTIALCIAASLHRATFRDTISLYEQLLAHHPSDEFYYRLALEHEKAGRTEDAFRALEEAKQAPHRIFFMRFLFYELQLADLYRRKGDLAAAADHLEAGIGWTPNAIEPSYAGTPWAFRYLADLRERAGDATGAAAARARAASAKPDPRLHFESTWIGVAPDEARRFLERWVASHPEDGAAWHLLAFIADRSGQPELARDHLQRARERGYRP